MAVTHNFTIEQGSDFAIQFIFQDVNGNNVDLTQGIVKVSSRSCSQINSK